MPRKPESKHLYLRAGTWWIRYKLNGQRFRHSLDTDDLNTARALRDRELAPMAAKDEAQRRKLLAMAADGAAAEARQVAEDARDRLAVTDAWQAFATSATRPQCGPVTLKDYGFQWGKFTKWYAAQGRDRPAIEQVTVADAGAFAQTLTAEKLSPNRFNKIIATCRLVFKTLAGDRPNPFAGIATKPLDPHGRRELSEGELRTVCGKATGELRTLLAIGLFTGLRLHDAVTLAWDAVKLPLTRLVVTPHKTRTRTRKTLVIPLHPVLQIILEETTPADRRGPVLPELSARYDRDPTAISRMIQRHFIACKITTQTDARTVRQRCEVGFHSLRHSFVTLCAAAGVPLAVVQELAGHASPAIQRAYLHMGEKETRAAIGALPNVMDPPPALPAARKDLDALRTKVHRLVKKADAATLRCILSQLGSHDAPS